MVFIIRTYNSSSLSRFRALFVFIFSAIFSKKRLIYGKKTDNNNHTKHNNNGNNNIFSFIYNNNISDTDLSGNTTSDSWFGCILTLFVSLLWAMADTIYRIMSNNCYNPFINHFILTCFFNGISGFFIFITFWWVFWFQNSNPFLLPIDNLNDIIWVGTVSLLLVIANIFQFLSLSLTSPFFLNVAMFLKIPLSFLVDVYIHGYKITYLSVSGGFLVIIGFLMLEVVNPPNYECCLFIICKKALFGNDYDYNINKLQTQRKFVEKYGYYGNLSNLMSDMSLFSYVITFK